MLFYVHECLNGMFAMHFAHYHWENITFNFICGEFIVKIKGSVNEGARQAAHCLMPSVTFRPQINLDWFGGIVRKLLSTKKEDNEYV